MEKMEEVESLAIRTITDHRDSYVSVKSKWSELYERYENKLREGSISSKTESKVTLGGAYALVENAIPRILGRDPKYRYLGRESGDEQVVELYDKFSEYQFEQADARKELHEVVKWGLITGLSGWKMGWKKTETLTYKNAKEIRGKRITNPLFVSALRALRLGNDVKVEETKTISNYTFRAIKPHDLFWSVRARDLSDASVFGHLDRMSIEDLEAQGFDVEKLVAAAKGTDYWMDLLKSSDGISTIEKTYGSIDFAVKTTEVEIAEAYVTKKNENGVTESYICWVGTVSGGSPRAIKTIQNPFDMQFCPMGIYRPVNRAGKFYGFGIIEPAIGSIDAEEDSLNIALETLWTSTVPPLEVNPGNLLDTQNFGYGPRNINYVRNLGQSMAVMPTQRPDVPGVSLFLSYLNKAKQNTSGITDYQTGTDQTKGNQTLGEIQIKTQESNARVGQMLKNLEAQVLEPMGKYALWLNQQYLADEKKVFFRILGRKGQFLSESIRFKDIEAVKDVIVISGSSALVVQQAELQKWVALLNQVYLEERSPVPTKINKLPIWERLFEQGLLIKDPETYLPSLKEIEEQEVGNNVEEMRKALQENAQPIQARVLPSDVESVHIPIHQAEIVKRKNQLDMAQQAGIEAPEEVVMELQMLVRHLDDHVLQRDGIVPEHSATMQVGQGINPQQNAQQTPQ